MMQDCIPVSRGIQFCRADLALVSICANKEFSEELATVIFFQLKITEYYFEFGHLFVVEKTRHWQANIS